MTPPRAFTASGPVALRACVIAATLALSCAPAVAVEATSADRILPGGWKVDDETNPTQISYATPERNDDAELLISCDRPNSELHFLYRKLPSDDVEAAIGDPATLDAKLSGAGKAIPLLAFVSRAPEGAAVGYDLLLTDNGAAAFNAGDLKLEFPNLVIDGPLDGAALQFISTCPKVSTVFESAAWRRRINLQAGFGIDLPLGLFRLSTADRFGRFYRQGPGNGTLQVSTVVNQDDLTTREAMKRMARDKDVVTKVTQNIDGKDSFTIAGTRGNRAVFLKALLTCDRGTWAIIRVEYDQDARTRYEPILTRLSQSFNKEDRFENQNACE